MLRCSKFKLASNPRPSFWSETTITNYKLGKRVVRNNPWKYHLRAPHPRLLQHSWPRGSRTQFPLRRQLLHNLFARLKLWCHKAPWAALWQRVRKLLKEAMAPFGLPSQPPRDGISKRQFQRRKEQVRTHTNLNRIDYDSVSVVESRGGRVAVSDNE